MEIRVLKYFLMVAREENITKAAKLLHVTQPTLSRQLMQLEDELGVVLFQRSKHRIILTDDGMLLKRRAQEIVALADKTEREFSNREVEISGEIAIGCAETQNMSVLSKHIREFREIYPYVQFNIYTANADDIKDRIEKGLLDIGLFMEPVDIDKYEFIHLPKKEQWGVLVRKDFKLANKTSVSPKDLVDVPLITIRREKVRNQLANWFGDLYDHLEIAATYNLILNAENMVKNNVGVALCFNMENLYSDLCFLPLNPNLETGAVLAWKKNQIFSPATNLFIKKIKNTF